MLAATDITPTRLAEKQKDDLVREKQILLQELQHRVANSLQIIASILLIKARTVRNEETRLQPHDAHKRIMSIAAMQKQLEAGKHGEPIEIGPYLTRLCETLAGSMIGEQRPGPSVNATACAAAVGHEFHISRGLHRYRSRTRRKQPFRIILECRTLHGVGQRK